MMYHSKVVCISLAWSCATISVFAAGAFFGDPPDAHHPWALHDQNRPQPPVVQPSLSLGGAPSDAKVLFDGSIESLQNWRYEKPEDKRRSDWYVEDGALVSVPGSGGLLSREAFGDCQLHIEWCAPEGLRKAGQARSNSGVFLMGLVEIQILDNYQNTTYADGSAGSVYGVMPPAANALRPSGQWQSYDIIFRRPIVREGVVLDPGSMTVLCNGVVVQDSTPLEGGGGYKKRKPLNRVFPDVGNLKLQDHGDSVRFRNIWLRPLRTRALDGGFDGYLNSAVTQKKRHEIAKGIREDAAVLSGLQKAFRLYESMIYASDPAALKTADAIIKDYLAGWSLQGVGKLNEEKADILHLQKALLYMKKHQILAPHHFALSLLEPIIDSQGWNKKRKP